MKEVEDIEKLYTLISKTAVKEANFHPVDRFFLAPYFQQLLSFDREDFLVYIFEQDNFLFNEYFLVCLPELWEGMYADNLVKLIKRFKSGLPFCQIIFFSYKYIEVNIIDLVFKLQEVDLAIKWDLLAYLNSQYPNFFKTETEYFFFAENLLGVSLEDWTYIKQLLLLDCRIQPSFETITELKAYLEKNIEKW